METLQRLLLIASPLMRRTPTYDRAAALAKAKGWRCTSSLSIRGRARHGGLGE